MNSQTVRKEAEKKQLPPDPDGMNGDRAKWAQTAIDTFEKTTGTDSEDAMSDLLADLMHLADRKETEFADELRRATANYEAETYGGPNAK